MKTEREYEIELGGYKFPVKLVIEPRQNGRISLASKDIIIRIPRALPYEEQNNIYTWARDNIRQLYQEKPQAFDKYISVDYAKKKILTTFHGDFEIRLKPLTQIDYFSSTIEEDVIEIKMPAETPTDDPFLGVMVAGVLKKRFFPQIYLRVHELNREHLNAPLSKVNLRNNSTRWGSCSSSKNISIATRALLAPEPILDYIIVHELCHLREMNHSGAYWELVASIDPSYKEKEAWLDEQGSKLKF